MKVLLTESKMVEVIDTLIDMLYPDIDKMDYDWAEYNCGMGVCCDPYAIGFTLPDSQYYEYLFKVVDNIMYHPYGDYPYELSEDLPERCYERPDKYLKDPRFNVIYVETTFVEDLEKYLGGELSLLNYRDEFIKVINKRLNINVRTFRMF